MATKDDDRAFAVGSLEEHEIPAFFSVDAAAFGYRMSARVKAMIEESLSRGRVVVTRAAGEVVGSAASEPSRMTVPGLVQVPTAMVVGVSVLPTHRRQGRLTALMRHQLDDLHSRGETIASLFASEGGIYGRFGYGQATFGSSYILDKRTARLTQAATEHGIGRVRLVDRSQAAEAIPAVHAAYAPTRAGEFVRHEIEFLAALGEEGGEDANRRWWVVYEDGGRIDGYAAYEITSADGPVGRDRKIIVHELCALGLHAYAALWQYLLGVDLTTELSAGGRPTDEPLRWMLTDPRQLRTTRTSDRTWVRLVDVGAALAQRRYSCAGDVVIGVRDPFCQWNEGSYRLVVAGDWETADVSRTAAEPDVLLDASTLGSIYLGGVPLYSFAQAGRVAAAAPSAVERVGRMFANVEAPHSLTSF